ncbi:MAG: hypothetical protein J6X58_05250 [Bacteroidales bacterium]|nr:hypothetical protein [Bacteroidales bacterium]
METKKIMDDPGSPAFDEKAFFDDLQSIWDDHAQRVDRIVEAHPAESVSIKGFTRFAKRGYKRSSVYIELILLTLAAAVYWAVIIPTLAYTTLALVASLIVEAVYILLIAAGLGGKISRRRLAAACMAAVFSLVVVSCTTTGIDGITITQNHPGRVQAVDNVANTLTQL